MANFQKILVNFRTKDGKVRLLRFTECLLELIESSGGNTGYISCELSSDKLIIQQTDKDCGGVKLEHPSFCPILHLSKGEIERLPSKVAERGVDVGVVGLVQSTDRQILLTRRADHMRTFPRTWVPPGGHIETGETLAEALAREIYEETGLRIDDCDCQLLCAWESVFPFRLSMGQPLRHHLVLYFLLKSSSSAREMAKSIQLDPGEVGACAWVNRQQAAVIASGIVDDHLEDLRLTVVDKEGATIGARMSCSMLAAEAPLAGDDIERVSTGTRYAVSNWLQATES